METRTHWKKNIDSKYISGEDLQHELKGLKKDFPVRLISFNDGETFDQSTQSKTFKTVLNLEDLNGNKLKKGVLLNKTTAKVFEDLTGSPIMEDWIDTVLNIYAQADRRFGFVVRFKKHIAPPVNIESAKTKLNNASDLEELGLAWSTLTKEEKLNTTVIKLKDELKEKLK